MFLKVGLFALGPLAIATVCACGGAPPERQDRIRLALSPASFGQTLSLQQQVHVETAGRAVDFDAALDIAPDSLTLIGMAFGQRMLTLRYDGVKLVEHRNPVLPREVRGADILTDVQMALWPVGAVRAALPGGWTVVDSDTLRTFWKGAHEVVTISYDAEPRTGDRVSRCRNLQATTIGS